MPDPRPGPSPARRWRDAAITGAVLALMLGGLIALAAATGWAETGAQLDKITAAQILILLGLSLVNYGLRAARWHLFARRLGLPLSAARNTLHFNAGFAMSATPGRVGELVRMRWIRRETGWPFDRTAPLMLMDRASDLTSMGLILALGLALSAGGIAGALPLIVLALASAWIATHPALLSGLATLSHRLTGRFARLFARIRRASRSLELFRSPLTIAVATLLGILGWLAEGYAFWLLLTWLGVDVPPALAIAIFVFATLAGGLTGAPGGLGGAEGAMIALLTLNGVAFTAAVSATLIIRLTTLWFAILLGLAAFPIAERQSRKAAHAHTPH